MKNKETFEYKLSKRNVGLYSELIKVIKFYFGNIDYVELDGETLKVVYFNEENSEENINETLEKLISDFIKGYKEFKEVIIAKGNKIAGTCKAVSDLEYIEIASGVRVSIGQRAIMERRMEEKIIDFYEKFPNCRFAAPSMTSYSNLLNSGYFTKFPNLINFVKNFNLDPELIKKVSKGDEPIDSKEFIDSNTTLSDKVLNPVTCYQVYPLANRLMKQTNKRNFTVSGHVFRFESYSMDMTRLNEIDIVEQVHIGKKEELVNIREEETKLYIDLFNDWELDFKIQTSCDAFFGADASLFISTQKYEKSKYEIKVKSDKGYISVGSLNLHNNYFAEKYNIKIDNEIACTSCSGIGIDRLIYCILSQHGSDVSLWPKKLREDLRM